MFRGFIPGKRVASVDLTAGKDASSKENRNATTTALKGIQKPAVFQDTNRNKVVKVDTTRNKQPGTDSAEMVEAFDKLLNDLQIPQTLRPKLNGMDSGVKAAMLRSSHAIQLGPSPPTSATPKNSHNTLRKTKSSDSLSSPRLRPSDALVHNFPEPPRTGRFFGAAMKSTTSLALSSNSSAGEARSFGGHSRGVSLDIPRNPSKAHLPLTAKNDQTSKPNKDKNSMKENSSARYITILTNTSSLALDVEVIKRLRLLLRNESASWTESFLECGGYSALLTRLNEILEVEWREEQHDDQVLHELLRCFKALSTSSVGCSALRSACPTPFAQLLRLLYSDKKPGEVATRQLIVELLLILFDLYPPSALPSFEAVTNTPHRREIWEDLSDDIPFRYFQENSQLITLPPPHRSLFSLLRELLLTKAPPPAEAPSTTISPHEFIESLHVPRIYKAYLQELSDICRDYFWVFCHPSNTIWNLEDTDERRVEKPRAPGGMTGGVEFEAMAYLTSHFRLLNCIARAAADLKLSKDNELSAHRFHSDLFASGLERIVLVARKASTTYYPTLHLELSRYVSLAMRAQFELPWTLSRTIGAPPAGMAKAGRGAKERSRSSANTSSSGSRSTPSTPARDRTRGNNAVGAPKLPTPKKIEPIRL